MASNGLYSDTRTPPHTCTFRCTHKKEYKKWLEKQKPIDQIKIKERQKKIKEAIDKRKKAK
tara:strand:+ start:732 stop:914 length:183 start_codon:yes stop_codon:yes gene_type:complete